MFSFSGFFLFISLGWTQFQASLTGFDWVLLGLTGLYRVLRGFTEFHEVLIKGS